MMDIRTTNGENKMKKLLILGLLVLGLSSCGSVDSESLEECINGDEDMCREIDAGTNNEDINDNTEDIEENEDNIEEIQDLLGLGDDSDNSASTPFVRPESIVTHLPWITCVEIDTVLELKECEEADIRVFEYSFIGDILEVGTVDYEFMGNGDDGTEAIFERIYESSSTPTSKLVERLTFSKFTKKLNRKIVRKVINYNGGWSDYTPNHNHDLRLVINSDLSVSSVWITGSNRDIVDTL